MTITAETYTTANGSNMDAITYNDSASIREIADDLKQYDNWDYAILTDDDDEIIATIEHNGTMTIKDPVSNGNTTVSVDAHVDIDEGTFYYVTYHAHTSTDVDCRFAVIEHESDMVCQSDWQSVSATHCDIADYDWVDCTPTDDELIDVSEATELLDVSRQRVHQLIQAGQLEGRKVGKTWYVYRHSVERRLRG